LTRDLETVKIADFGVARINQSDSPITRVGTNIYAPPEHSPMLSGEDDGFRYYGLTFAADIYSLAKSMYTLLTCESPRYFANQPIGALPAACRAEPWADEFLKVVNKATQSDPSARHQTVDEFWEDLAGVREIATEGEITTLVGAKVSDIPQAHVARGYSPLAPVKPHFDTSRDLRLRTPLIAGAAPSVITRDPVLPIDPPRPQPIERAEDHWPQPEREDSNTIFVEPDIAYRDTVEGRKRKRRVRLAVFMVLILGFGGALYGTGAYLRGAGAWPDFRNLFNSKTAVANTDIYLRPEPNTNNDPIGLVTKNSKVRIVNSQNNWYQVDVIQQGREKPVGPNATRGWLNGKFIDIDGD
jgi:serine/threonine protein kinase